MDTDEDPSPEKREHPMDGIDSINEITWLDKVETEEYPSYDEVADYIGEKGVISIFQTISPQDGARHKQLKKRVPVANSTLDNRLDEARELDLIEHTMVEIEGSTQPRYVFTDFGAEIRQKMQSVGLFRLQTKILTLEGERDEQKEELKRWLEIVYLHYIDPPEGDPQNKS